MMLIFTLERQDVLPVDDLGVREGYKRLKGLAEAPTPKALKQIGESWQPYRSAASCYLWRVPKL
jgi:DNA-3-methyladenine glycosylase II